MHYGAGDAHTGLERGTPASCHSIGKYSGSGKMPGKLEPCDPAVPAPAGCDETSSDQTRGLDRRGILIRLGPQLGEKKLQRG